MQERNVSKAAARLALTQPAVSGMLNRLRESLNDPLFVRSQQGVAPTQRAIELAAPVQRILAELDSVLSPTVFSPLESDLTFKLAGTDYSLSAIIVPLIEEIKVRAPRIRIASFFIQDDLVFQQMEKGDVDIAFMTPDTAPGELRGKTLFEEEYVCILSAANSLARKNTLTLDEFCDAEHAIVSYQGGAFEGVTDKVLSEHNCVRRVTVSVPSFLVLKDLIRKTDLLAVVPKRLVANDESLKTVDLPFSIPGFTKYMVWHECTHKHPAYQWLREQITMVVNTKS